MFQVFDHQLHGAGFVLVGQGLDDVGVLASALAALVLWYMRVMRAQREISSSRICASTVAISSAMRTSIAGS